MPPHKWPKAPFARRECFVCDSLLSVNSPTRCTVTTVLHVSVVANIMHAMQVLVAESYGGRDEPVDTLVNNLVAVNVVPVFDALRVKELPTEGTYQARTSAHCAAACSLCAY